MIIRLFSSFIVFLSVACTTAQTPSAELETTLANFAEAFQSGDVETVSAHIAESYVHVNSGGAPYDRAQWLGWYAGYAAEIVSGDHVFKNYAVHSLDITTHDDAAYVTGIVRADGTRFGEAFAQNIRFTNLWIVENGQWKRAGFHDVTSNE